MSDWYKDAIFYEVHVKAFRDGDGNGVAGGDFVQIINVPPYQFGIPAPAISIPNFARGPGQAVNVPATATSGIPVTLSEGNGLNSVRFDLRYDPALLNITAVRIAPTAPPGGVNTAEPGTRSSGGAPGMSAAVGVRSATVTYPVALTKAANASLVTSVASIQNPLMEICLLRAVYAKFTSSSLGPMWKVPGGTYTIPGGLVRLYLLPGATP